jgi:hypothetical protein
MSHLHVVPNIRTVYIWRTPKETYNPECLVPTVKHESGSVLIWTEISWYSAGPTITLHVLITASDYVDNSRNHVRPVIQMFRKNYANLHDEIRPYTQKEVFSLGSRSVKMHFNIFPGQHNCQT